MSLLKSVYFWLILTFLAVVYASQHYTIGGWEHLRIVSKQTDAPKPTSDGGTVPKFDNRSWAPARWVSAPSVVGDIAPPKPKIPSIRIATLNLQGFGENKASKMAVLEILARVLRSFDVIALQDVQPDQGDVLPRLVDRINQSDRAYDYCIGPRVGKGLNSMHFAFVFDSERVDIDRYQLYTVDDPMDQLEYEPLVGWFRTKNVHEEEAFTFSLVNVRISPPYADREIALLPELIRTIVRDGRDEDDVLVAGDFACGNERMENLRRIGMRFALEGVTTTVASDEMLDNILFPAKATDEYLGRSGTIDFLRQLNLTPEQAFQVSNHMPVWAEFSAVEGGVPGYAP
ncbi:MAG: endonuclease/exonuclease/phosphatase family protein [Pirellula sp.]|jgi:endonuclease/exonuclease/phosphatase family metal-dependent hydrolase|nr:endonuclease/exonuclease/phosphatase family protein [Pirellula sp.]